MEKNKKIAKDFKSGKITLEDVFDKLNKNGSCPGLIHDDNGHYALSFSGMQDVSFGKEPTDICTSFFVEAKEWKGTVREAVIYALEALGE